MGFGERGGGDGDGRGD
jgi:hypothetical protein